jgi:hypothetical protein
MGNLMKPTDLTVLLLRLLTLFALSVSTAAQADPAGSEHRINASRPEAAAGIRPAVVVDYNKVSDQLSVTADRASLKAVLGRIAQQSGIEVMFDDMAEESVSANIQSETLESSLKNLLKGGNYMLRYSRDEQQKLLLIGVMVLPVGEQDTGRARRIMAMDQEAMNRARSQLSLAQTQQMDLSNERWQARLTELPPASREQLEKQVEKGLLKQAQREQQRAEKKKKYEQKSAEAQQKRQAKREEYLQSLSPEERSDFEQRSSAARQQVKAWVSAEQK